MRHNQQIMKIVIVTHLIYPALNPRAFRSTELAKEFARQGHDVRLYAVTGNYDYTDFMKETGIKVCPIKPKFDTVNAGSAKASLFRRACRKLSYYFFDFPHIEMSWLSYKLLKEEENIDLLVTIAYPHPIHWGAAFLKKHSPQNFAKTWISDCGDPYMLNPLEKRRWYFKYMEEFWGRMTDYITIPIEEAKKSYYPSVQSKLRIIPQGFNFTNIKLDTYQKHNIPHFAYAGSIYAGSRDPTTFLQYLMTLKHDFRFTVYTKTPAFFEEFKNKLGDKLQIRTFIPREQLIFELSGQDFLINLTNPFSVQAPSKLIDYALTQRPIVRISTPFNEEEKMQKIFDKGEVDNDYADIDISAYDIRNVADAFLALTDRT